MLIPEGSYTESRSSSRIGILVGIFRKGKMGIEGGYFHDFASMPISKLYIPSWDKFIAKDENKLYEMFASQVFALGKINQRKNENVRLSLFFFITALISELLIIMSMAYSRALPYLFPTG